jgi:hypothetical protein
MEDRISVEVSGQLNVTCVGCGDISDVFWAGWRAYRVDLREHGASPALTLLCPACADKEFGYSRRV